MVNLIYILYLLMELNNYFGATEKEKIDYKYGTEVVFANI